MPHIHICEEEYSSVLECERDVRVDNQIAQVPSGCFIFKPRGFPPTIWNAEALIVVLKKVAAVVSSAVSAQAEDLPA